MEEACLWDSVEALSKKNRGRPSLNSHPAFTSNDRIGQFEIPK